LKKSNVPVLQRQFHSYLLVTTTGNQSQLPLTREEQLPSCANSYYLLPLIVLYLLRQ